MKNLFEVESLIDFATVLLTSRLPLLVLSWLLLQAYVLPSRNRKVWDKHLGSGDNMLETLGKHMKDMNAEQM